MAASNANVVTSRYYTLSSYETTTGTQPVQFNKLDADLCYSAMRPGQNASIAMFQSVTVHMKIHRSKSKRAAINNEVPVKSSHVADSGVTNDSPPVNKLHLELFHHFATDVLAFPGFDMLSSEGSAIDMTRYILSAPYLMNQILAFAALHLSVIHTTRQEFYQYHSSQLQTHALSEFNGGNLDVSADTCVPMFLFSSCLAMHVLAEKLLFRPDSFEDFLDHFVQSLRMHRGVRAVTNKSWHLLLQSPLKPLLEIEQMILDQSTSGNECVELLAHLDAIYDPVIDSIYRQTIEDLQKAFNASRSPLSNFSRIGPIIFWPVNITPEYIDLLSERRPEALAVLSHFGALLHLHREIWTFGNSGLYLISSISNYLGPQWESWLRWPNTFMHEP
ncbi:uncharacterized protein N7511_007686 [Penicillium nucicola]|uniref:uncharacterized protein n=1 Tax=Penicillium nucicola TaxID=1850975 RepID=UPI002544E456|nr:uncharacterized protein N7511_007686 [Penicillium nucicola]KAJ5753533.1 hypothetical protein N7511_007686 [Penicillium nucicola]